ncbi:SxtJ family membrane protein [Persicitalea sp.]|uniref:SxtJ family membrane protein n=1 Tax=Persicitalea sp. TaxID=3100273 RepID=UPI003594028B
MENKISEADRAKAQLVIVTGLLVIYFIFKSRYPWMLYAAATVGVLCIAIPIVGEWIVKGWFKIAEILGAINGRILLSIVFFLILSPIAFLSRMGRKNPLSLKSENKESAFTERNHLYTPKDLDQVW